MEKNETLQNPLEKFQQAAERQIESLKESFPFWVNEDYVYRGRWPNAFTDQVGGILRKLPEFNEAKMANFNPDLIMEGLIDIAALDFQKWVKEQKEKKS